MSLDITEGKPVHTPANPDRFAFDEEVSAIFPNMALRAIPNFYEAHTAHARMLAPWLKPGASLLDVGASRGAFFAALQQQHPDKFDDLNLTAIDNSRDMCAYLRGDFPQANVLDLDVGSPSFLDHSMALYDVVCVHYVLQFVPPELQMRVLLKLISMVKPGGVFIFGHKAKHFGWSGQLAHDEYLLFRAGNGYSREEIEAKTRALKGSMWPMNHHQVLNEVRAQCEEVQETFRFMMFSTFFAVK